MVTYAGGCVFGGNNPAELNVQVIFAWCFRESARVYELDSGDFPAADVESKFGLELVGVDPLYLKAGLAKHALDDITQNKARTVIPAQAVSIGKNKHHVLCIGKVRFWAELSSAPGAMKLEPIKG